MLQSLTINNFAIIDTLNVQFEAGMSVLTGETGAGKSIMIDALALLVGGRGSSEWIRHGQTKATIQGVFDIEQAHVTCALLDDYGINYEDNELLLYRDIQQSGKSQARINGTPVTIAMLREVGQSLLDIHSQNEHHHLMDESKHLQLLDKFAYPQLAQAKEQYARLFDEYQRCKKQVRTLMLADQADTQKVALLKTQLSDIEQVMPKEHEDSRLEAEWQLLQNQKKVSEALALLDTLFYAEENGVLDAMRKGVQASQSIRQVHERYDQLAQQIDVSVEQLMSVAKQVVQLRDNVDEDDARLYEVNERLNAINQLKAKYGDTLADVLAYYQSIQQDYLDLTQRDKRLSQAQQSFLEVRQRLVEIGNAITQIRQRAAQQLEEAIQQQLQQLYMEKAVFKVAFKEHATDKLLIKESGLDDVAFLMVTNVGEPFKPLAKVASGGEMSRIMLAIKTILTSSQDLTSIIFDEVDTGVSGRVAQAIADKMYRIAEHAQVLCITHLAQVAAKADYHLFISKETDGTRTYTAVQQLDKQQREQEVARMIAGEQLSESALQHAKELLSQSK